MRRKSSELNIFSMSALDLFASALGAFILIVLILLPYYLKEQPTCPEPVVCPVPQPIPECPVCPAPAPVPECPPLPEPNIKFADNLLVMQMSWAKKGDIDLHILSPDGEYFFSRTYIEGKPGRFTLDNREGGTSAKPALEIWKSYKPTVGQYKICYVYYAGNQGAISVSGRLDKPTGPIVLPTKILRKGEKVCPLTFTMSEDFSFTVTNRE